jgi:hypothetical protein
MSKELPSRRDIEDPVNGQIRPSLTTVFVGERSLQSLPPGMGLLGARSGVLVRIGSEGASRAVGLRRDPRFRFAHGHREEAYAWGAAETDIAAQLFDRFRALYGILRGPPQKKLRGNNTSSTGRGPFGLLARARLSSGSFPAMPGQQSI